LITVYKSNLDMALYYGCYGYIISTCDLKDKYNKESCIFK